MVDCDIFDNQTVYYKSSENMQEIKDNSIDVIVTSPPYNRNKFYSDDLGGIYNDKQPEEEYFQFLTRVWRECFRVLNPRGIFFLNIGDAASDQGLSENVVQLAVETGFHRLQTVIWIKSFLGKGHFTPSGGSRRLNNLWENIFVLVKDRKRYYINPKAIGIPYADKTNIGRYADEDLRDAGNIWLIPYSKTTGATIKKGHEAPFPVELPYKCIKLAEGETVLDPFVGTGSTLAASRLLNKKGFGYEKFPRKEVIRKRIMEESFKETPAVLLPHMELAISILSRYCSMINYNQLHEKGFLRFSQKEKTQLKILKDTLNQLNKQIPFLEEYFDQWEKKREKKKIEILTKFLEES
ncbi:MAG: DNA-methyltransferase [Candidatus Hodarchaeota archaeon]